jgi:hypothetical protein
MIVKPLLIEAGHEFKKMHEHHQKVLIHRSATLLKGFTIPTEWPDLLKVCGLACAGDFIVVAHEFGLYLAKYGTKIVFEQVYCSLLEGEQISAAGLYCPGGAPSMSTCAVIAFPLSPPERLIECPLNGGPGILRAFTSWNGGEVVVGVAVENGAIVVSTSNDRIIKLEQTNSGNFAPMLGISAVQAQSLVAHRGIYLLQGEGGVLTAITNDTADVLGLWRYPSDKEWTGNCIIGDQLISISRDDNKHSELWEFPMAGIGKKHGGLQPAMSW